MQLTVNTIKQASHYLLLCVLVSIGLSSCHKDIEEADEVITTPVTQVDIKELTQADVVGYIYDETDAPMADVEVSILGKLTRTNEYGVFVFRNIDLDANGTYIKATKSGYIIGSDRIYPDKADVNHSYIKMMRLTSTTTVNGANGGNIVVQGGGIISFGANTIVNSDGVTYLDNVTVTAKRIAADDPDLADVMPGGLIAQDKEGYTQVLGTLGMVAVELRDANGNELNLADGAEATVQFPIAEGQLSDAPDQIALWSFDEAKGLWIEEGFATRQGNNYIGQVQHFSFWNCDAPFPLIHICGTVLNADGTPATNVSIQIQADVIYSVGYGVTDSQGRFCGKMPQGEELTITIFHSGCQQEGFIYTVGPFDSDTELDPVSLANVNNGFITGTVLCDGNPVADASIIVYINQQTLVYLADESGNYSFNTSVFGCEAIEESSIFAINNLTGEASSVQVFDVNTNTSIDFNTCGGCDMSLITSTGFTDDICSRESYYATVDVIDPNGMVTYSWNNGSTSQTINNIENGLYCVTVTDNEDCQEISCIEFVFNALGDSLLINNASCEMSNGSIEHRPFGGAAPYLFEVSNDGDLISTEPIVTGLAAGTYTVLVTDSNGCTFESEGEVLEIGGIPDFQIFEECGVTQLSISPNFGDFNIEFEGETFTNFVEVYQSGFYCFEISNSQGCFESRCIDVLVQEDIFYPIEVICTYPNYNLEWDTDVFSVLYNSLDTVNNLAVQFASGISISPLQFGYSGILYLENDFQMCGYEEVINLPRFNGLNAVGNSPSCDDCEDGFIDIVVDVDADCFNCQFGEVTIFDAENDPLLEMELGELNLAQELPSGRYYVIVTDEVTGCIIAHRNIEL